LHFGDFPMNENLLIFVAGMVTAYIFHYFSILLMRARHPCACGCGGATAGDAARPEAVAPPPSDDDALVALAIAAASRR